MNLFRVYICVALFLIVVLLGVLTGSVIFAGEKIRSETSTVTSKIDTFNNEVSNINKSLSNINSQLQSENNKLGTSVTIP